MNLRISHTFNLAEKEGMDVFILFIFSYFFILFSFIFLLSNLPFGLLEELVF